MEIHKILVRKYRQGDEAAVKKLVAQGALVTVNPFFLNSVVKEGIIQLTLMLAAVLFIAVGTTLKQSLCAVPIVVVSLYVGIYVGHWVKIFRAHTDLNNIHSNYLDDPKKGFWVAVLLNPVKDASKDYVFYGEADFNEETMQKSLNPTPRHLVGVIAVDVKDDPDMREPPESVALIKRMTVNKSHQRKGIGTVLLRTALDHCLQHKFRAVELVTTEHHVAARSLYADHGFELQATVQKRYLLWGLITLTMHRLRVACSTVAKLKDKPRKITEAELYSKVD